MTIQPHIPTYFSHSYRPEDRAVNEQIWALFARAGFGFTVDPESIGLSIAQLELMMRRSDCFVAVATHRPEQQYYQTSPFVVYEYGLAVQADKPALVFTEAGVAQKSFDPAHRISFRRDALTPAWSKKCHTRIRELARTGREESLDIVRGTGSVGLLLPRTEPYAQVRGDIESLLDRAGYEVVTLKTQWRNPADFLRRLDQQDFVLVDVGGDETLSWVFPLLYGRFIPSLRLMQVDGARQESTGLPDLMLGDALETVAASDEWAVWWSTPDELLSGLERELVHLRRERTQFRSLDEGVAYFHSLGRASDGPVFVSNAATDNALAMELTRRLEAYNVRVFQYQYRNSIERSGDWRTALLDRVRTARLFIALISSNYWESQWCQAEYDLAEGLWERHLLEVYPYFLDDSARPDRTIAPQGTALLDLSLDQRADIVVAHVEEQLMQEKVTTRPSGTGPSWAQDTEPRVDVAMVTILQEEYEAVLAQFDWHATARGSERHPNAHAWELGEIAPTHGPPYRVVVGMASQAGAGGGLLSVRNTIEAFRPRYVLLIGVAGGIGDVALGDVVVSSRIYGYEYGKVDGGFRPRPDWVYPTDGAVTTAAAAMRSRHPDWWHAREPSAAATSSGAPPTIHVAPVASGNKVVDDLSDPAFRPVLTFWPKLRAVEMEGLGAAEAIQDAREHGHSVNFAMIRGICDLPRAQNDASGENDDDTGSSQTLERDAWKRQASDAAARLAAEMIKRAWSRPPRAD